MTATANSVSPATFRAATGRLLRIGAAATTMTVCACLGGPKPFVMQGTAEAVEVIYSDDLPDATALARAHCLQYERIAWLTLATGSHAYFDCLRR